MYRDRHDAGRRLAGRLEAYRAEGPVVLGLPRGGIVVAYEVARALGAPLDVLVARKLAVPGRPEVGIGVVVDGDHPEAVVDERLASALGISRDYLREEIARQLEEVRRREALLRAGRARVDLRNRTVLVVDDGMATGMTVARPCAACGAHSLAASCCRPRRSADRGVGARARRRRDRLPRDAASLQRRRAVLRDFAQTSDDEVITLLARAASAAGRCGQGRQPAGERGGAG
jgi:putative phosphoribosyl transferase